MKKFFIIMGGLIMIPILVHAQQDKETKNRDQSLTITLAPTYYTTFDDKLFPDTFCPPSLYVTKNFSIKKRLSFSTGIHLIYKKSLSEGFIIVEGIPSYSGPVKFTYKYAVFDIPLRLNYHIIKPNSKFNLYAKTEIRNSLIANYKKVDPDQYGKYGSHTDYGYDMFLGIGFGLDFRVVERLSVVIEPGLNYSVFGLLPNEGLADCQIGIKYALSKK
jgi:hypothetical protein